MPFQVTTTFGMWSHLYHLKFEIFQNKKVLWNKSNLILKMISTWVILKVIKWVAYFDSFYVKLFLIIYVLGDLLLFVQFKNHEKTHGGVLLLYFATLLKLTPVHGCCSRFLNCTNGTKSRNTSHILESL